MRVKGHDVGKVYIKGPVTSTRTMMIIVMCMSKDREKEYGKMGKIMSLGKGHFWSRHRFLTTFHLVLFPNNK